MSVEIVNEIRPVINIFVRSNVSDSFPIGRIKAAENSKKMVITRFRFSATKLNFLAMSGAAMLIALDIKGTKNEEVVVADFFAGTGNVGIEFLSRGVKEVVFVEKDERCVHVIKENLKDLGLSERAKVFKTDVLRFLRSKHCPIFDIIFLDPPYKSTYAAECIEEILKNNKISQNGLIVVESNLDFNFESAKLTILRQREYGDTKITIFSFGGRQF